MFKEPPIHSLYQAEKMKGNGLEIISAFSCCQKWKWCFNRGEIFSNNK